MITSQNPEARRSRRFLGVGPLGWTAVGCGGLIFLTLLALIGLYIWLPRREIQGGRPPAWVPLYPRTQVEEHVRRGGLLQTSGTFRLRTTDPQPPVREFYEREARRLGFQVSPWFEGQVPSLIALGPADGRELDVNLFPPRPGARERSLLIHVHYRDRYRFKR